MKILAVISLLLLGALDAGAVCFVHPDTRVTYCYHASECPSGTTWEASTQQCKVPAPPPRSESGGSYVPGGFSSSNVDALTPRKAFWTRSGSVVTVSGSVALSSIRASALIPGGAPTVFYLHPPIDVGHDLATEDLAGVVNSESGAAGTVMGASGVAMFHYYPRVAGPDVVRYVYSYEVR